MTEGFEIFPQNVAKDGTLIIIQKGLKLYNITDVVDLLNELTEENSKLHIQNDFLKDENRHMRDLVNENNQLKEENIAIKKTLHTIINQIDVDKINNNKIVYSARILFKEKEFQFIYDIYKKSLEEL